MSGGLQWWLPTTPYTAVDAVNKAWLATGDARNAMVGAEADYNGHRFEVGVVIRQGARPERPVYSVSYTWAGVNFVVRGVALGEAVAVAVRAARSSGRGSSVVVRVGEEDRVLAGVVCGDAGLVPYEGPITAHEHLEANFPWQCGGTWTGHTAVGHAHVAVRLERQEGIPMALFLEAGSYEDWIARRSQWKSDTQSGRRNPLRSPA